MLLGHIAQQNEDARLKARALVNRAAVQALLDDLQHRAAVGEWHSPAITRIKERILSFVR